MYIFCDDLVVSGQRITPQVRSNDDDDNLMDQNQENLHPFAPVKFGLRSQWARVNEASSTPTKHSHDTSYDASASELSGTEDTSTVRSRSPSALSVDDSEHSENSPLRVTRDSILNAAERLIDNLNVHKRAAPEPTGPSDKRHYVKGPVKRRRTTPKKPQQITTVSKYFDPTNDKTSTLPTPPNSAKSNQSATSTRKVSGNAAHYNLKVLHDFPPSTDTLPDNVTLERLCAEFPNHLFGENMHPFIQHNWTGAQMYKLLPSQEHLEVSDRISQSVISKRLCKAKKLLEQEGQLQALMDAPKIMECKGAGK